MCGMRDQEIEFACLAEEGDALRPMRLRYGVTRNEATHHEPLEVGLAQEDAEVPADDDATARTDLEAGRLGQIVLRPHAYGEDNEIGWKTATTLRDHDQAAV